MSQVEIKPAIDAAAITLSDVTVYTPPYRAFYVGTGGDVKIKTAMGNDITFKNVPVGMLLPQGAKMFYSTGTTAADIVGLL